MQKKLFLFFYFLCFSSLFANSDNLALPEPIFRYIISHDTFQGTESGYFEGDRVCILDDDSYWKIHPNDHIKYSNWNINDQVGIRLRPKDYYFKREHKFEIYNYSYQEAIRVMLVKYPTHPLYITKIEKVETGQKIQSRQLKDHKGRIIRDENNQPFKYQAIVSNYETQVHLSNGERWSCNNWDVRLVKAGNFVYIGLNMDSNKFFYFLIFNSETEAKHFEVVKK